MKNDIIPMTHIFEMLFKHSDNKLMQLENTVLVHSMFLDCKLHERKQTQFYRFVAKHVLDRFGLL